MIKIQGKDLAEILGIKESSLRVILSRKKLQLKQEYLEEILQLIYVSKKYIKGSKETQ